MPLPSLRLVFLICKGDSNSAHHAQGFARVRYTNDDKGSACDVPDKQETCPHSAHRWLRGSPMMETPQCSPSPNLPAKLTGPPACPGPGAQEVLRVAGLQRTAADPMLKEGSCKSHKTAARWHGATLEKRIRGARLESLVLGASPLQGAAPRTGAPCSRIPLEEGQALSAAQRPFRKPPLFQAHGGEGRGAE